MPLAGKRRVRRRQGDVGQVVEFREQAHPGEPADSGEEAEPHVRVGVLDHAVEAAQVVPVAPRGFGFPENVQNRLVVLVDQYHGPPAGLSVERADQAAQPDGRRPRTARHIEVAFDFLEPRFRDVGKRSAAEIRAAPAQPDHRMALGPLSAGMDLEAPEQGLVPLEEFLQRVEEQALPESPRPGQEVVLALFHQPLREAGLVHVVEAALADLAEGLDAYRQP